MYGSGDSADDDAEQEWVLYCLNKVSGKVLWRQIAHRGVWVEPFLFVSHQQPGFIYAARDVGRDGIQRGVWAVQFEVAYLSEFLSTLHLGRSGRVYVVTRSGLVVGHPHGEVTEMVNGVKQIARAENHRDPMLAGAWKELQQRGPGTRVFSFGPYLSMVADFPPESGIDWEVIGVVPKIDYFGCILIAPSKRMTSPFNISLRMISETSEAYSSGRPSRGGNGTIFPRDC